MFGTQSYFTEPFASGFDLEGLSVLFIPDGGPDFYVGCDEDLAGLPTDPTGGTALPLTDDSFLEVTPPQSVSLYGTSYNSFFVGSNGYITFGTGDRTYTETLPDHFDLPRISGAFDDLNPSAGGTVSWKDAGDRVAVTWEDVPEFSNTGANTFQIEIFYADGTIRMSYLSMTLDDCIAGLSEGNGVPVPFFPTNLSHMGTCGPRPPSASSSNVEVPIDTPTPIELVARDDGLPDPPAALTYIVVSLPGEGSLQDSGNGHNIVSGDLPYTLSGGGNQALYSPGAGFWGNDGFQFKANDGGVPPEGGDSNIATVSILVLFDPPQITTPSLPNGCINQAYGPVQLEAIQGQPELSWFVVPEGEYTEWQMGSATFELVGDAQGWNADDGSWPYTLPFPFPFYGQDYNNVWITSNGVIDFANVFADWTNSDAELIANVRIAPMWDDLRTDQGGSDDIYIDESVPDQVTIRWKTVTYAAPQQPCNHSVTLFSDGRMQFNYGAGNGAQEPLTPTIGISDGGGVNFLLSLYNNRGVLRNAPPLELTPVLPLPDGMSLSPQGELAGTPTEFGEFLPRIRVTDSLGRTDEVQLPLTISETCGCVPCDMNCDGVVNASDIEPFIDLLFNGAPQCNPGCTGDTNGDGRVDAGDIEGFISCLFP